MAEPKSFISVRTTDKPRPAASLATPHPFTPPPIINKSCTFLFNLRSQILLIIFFLFRFFSFNFRIVQKRRYSNGKERNLLVIMIFEIIFLVIYL